MKWTFAPLLLSSVVLLVSALNFKPAESSLKVYGTSSLHDWEIVVEEYNATGQWDGSSLKNFKLVAQTASLESGNSTMNGKAHDALEAKKHPQISFSAAEMRLNGNRLEGQGSLVVAGKTRKFSLKVPAQVEGKNLRLQGKVPLRMTDFDIQPPTAMFGTLKTGDAVEVGFDLQFSF